MVFCKVDRPERRSTSLEEFLEEATEAVLTVCGDSDQSRLISHGK